MMGFAFGKRITCHLTGNDHTSLVRGDTDGTWDKILIQLKFSATFGNLVEHEDILLQWHTLATDVTATIK